MESNSDEHDSAQRRLEKVICVLCAGTGEIRGVKRCSCRSCSGKGWVELEAGKESICPECNGDGTAEYEVKSACHECESKGYKIRIVELTPIKEVCFECDGKGTITESGICDDCDGSGTNRWTLADGSKCLKCDGSGETIQSNTCPICDGVGEYECGSYKTTDITPRK